MRGWFLVIVGACGFHPGAVASDGPVSTTDEGAPTEAALGSCWPHWFDSSLSFNPTQPVTSVDMSSGNFKQDVSLSPDELQIWFQSNYHVWTATRADTSAGFDPPALFAAANSPATEGKMTMTDNGLAFVVSSSRTGGKGLSDLWISTRAHATDNFPPPNETHLKNVDTPDAEYDPWISSDLLHLYYAPAPAGQHQHLVEASRDAVSKDFDPPVALDTINQSVVSSSSFLGYYEDVMLADDETIAVYSAHRTDNVGASATVDPPPTTDLWYSIRHDATQPFSPPIHVPNVNTMASEVDPWISSDGCRLYFASDSDGPITAIYEASVVN